MTLKIDKPSIDVDCRGDLACRPMIEITSCRAVIDDLPMDDAKI